MRDKLPEGEVEPGNAPGRQRQRTEQGAEDTELGGRPQQQGTRVGQHRTEVRHGTHAHEDQQGEHAGRDTHVIDQLEQPARLGHAGHRQVGQYATKPDGNQQQRLEALADSQVDQRQADQDHQHLTRCNVEQTCGLPQECQLFHGALLSLWSPGYRPRTRHHRP